MFLSDTPLPTLTILGLYYYFIFKLGPKLMENRPPFKLETVMLIYNLVQVIANGYIVFTVRFLIIRHECRTKMDCRDHTVGSVRNDSTILCAKPLIIIEIRLLQYHVICILLSVAFTVWKKVSTTLNIFVSIKFT